MKNNILVRNITNEIIFLGLIIYIFFGTLIYTNWISGYLNLINICNYLITNLNYLIIFVLPSFLFLSSHIYKKINNNTFIIRFKKRKNYFDFLFKTSVKCTVILYIIFLLIIAITQNIVGFSYISIEAINYTNNLVLLILNSIKLLLFVVTFQIIHLIVHTSCKNSNNANLINFGIISLIYCTKYFSYINNNSLIRNIMPTNHLTDLATNFNSIKSNLIFTFIMYILLYSLIYFIYIKKLSNKEFLERE